MHDRYTMHSVKMGFSSVQVSMVIMATTPKLLEVNAGSRAQCQRALQLEHSIRIGPVWREFTAAFWDSRI